MLLGYVIVLIGVGIGVLTVRHRRVAAKIIGDVPDLDPYTAATLEGGPERVALTVLCEMVDGGVLEVNKRGRVSIRTDIDRPTDPMQLAVLRAIEGRKELLAHNVLQAAKRQPEMRLPEEPARRRRLLFEEDERRRLVLLPWPLLVTSVVGFVIVFTDTRQYPAALILMPLVIFGFISSIALGFSTPRYTSLGKAALRRSVQFYRLRDRPETLLIEGRPYRSASIGVAALGGTAVRDANLYNALFSSND